MGHGECFDYCLVEEPQLGFSVTVISFDNTLFKEVVLVNFQTCQANTRRTIAKGLNGHSLSISVSYLTTTVLARFYSSLKVISSAFNWQSWQTTVLSMAQRYQQKYLDNQCVALLNTQWVLLVTAVRL